MTDQTPAETRAATLREAWNAAHKEGSRLEEVAGIEAARGARCVARILRLMADEAQPSDKLASVLAEIRAERARQDAKWGEQNHPDGTGPEMQMLPGWKAKLRAELVQVAAVTVAWIQAIDRRPTAN